MCMIIVFEKSICHFFVDLFHCLKYIFFPKKPGMFSQGKLTVIPSKMFLVAPLPLHNYKSKLLSKFCLL